MPQENKPNTFCPEARRTNHENRNSCQTVHNNPCALALIPCSPLPTPLLDSETSGRAAAAEHTLTCSSSMAHRVRDTFICGWKNDGRFKRVAWLTQEGGRQHPPGRLN